MTPEEKQLLQDLQDQKWDPDLLKQKIQLLLDEKQKTNYHKIPNRF